MALHVHFEKADLRIVLNGEFEILENAYPSWQSIQISVHKASVNLYQHMYYEMCLTQE